jgi:hypothetical protein
VKKTTSLLETAMSTTLSAGNCAPSSIPPNWLRPEGAQASPDASETDAFLQSIAGRVRPLVCQYRDSALASAVPTGAARGWTCCLQAQKQGEDCLDLSVCFALKEGKAAFSGVAVAFDFAGWTTENYVFAPGMIYDGNRFRIYPIGYPPYIHDPRMRPLDMPITVTNILHLSNEKKPGKVEMKTFNGATPAMGFWDRAKKRGFLVLLEPETKLGVSGMIMEENPQTKQMSFVVSAPGVRSCCYAMCGRAPSGDQGAAFEAGDEITLKFKVYSFAAADIPAYYAKFFEERKALTGPNTYRDVTPYSAAADMLAAWHDQTKWRENCGGYYFGNNYGQYAFQIGWSAIPIYSHAAFANPSPERLRRGAATLDYLTRAQAKTGLFCAILRDGHRMGDAFGKAEEQPDISMVRRSGETLQFGIQQLDLLRDQGQPVKPEWEAMFRRCADALVKVFERYGQFGQFIDIETGEMQINGSTGGSACVGGLAWAWRYFHEPQYLEAAEKSGRFYYAQHLAKGYCGGGPAEILQSPDSESAANLCEAYMALYEATGEDEWLDRARLALHTLASWMVSYDYNFPKGYALERVGVKATGTIFASSQNNHSAPGLYILSGDFALKFYRATGDNRVAEMYKDMVHNVVQYMHTKHNPIQPGQPDGLTTERVQLSDWEGAGNGNIATGDSNMAWETLVELTVLQNPGVYLNTDTNDLLVLDHVQAKVVSKDAQGTILEFVNTTPYDAQVKVLAESTEEARKPLACTACLHWPKVAVKSGETKRIKVGADSSHTISQGSGAG